MNKDVEIEHKCVHFQQIHSQAYRQWEAFFFFFVLKLFKRPQKGHKKDQKKVQDQKLD